MGELFSSRSTMMKVAVVFLAVVVSAGLAQLNPAVQQTVNAANAQVRASLRRASDFAKFVYRPEDQYVYDINNPQPFRFDASDIVEGLNNRFQNNGGSFSAQPSANTYSYEYNVAPYVYNNNKPFVY